MTNTISQRPPTGDDSIHRTRAEREPFLSMQ